MPNGHVGRAKKGAFFTVEMAGRIDHTRQLLLEGVWKAELVFCCEKRTSEVCCHCGEHSNSCECEHLAAVQFGESNWKRVVTAKRQWIELHLIPPDRLPSHSEPAGETHDTAIRAEPSCNTTHLYPPKVHATHERVSARHGVICTDTTKGRDPGREEED